MSVPVCQKCGAPLQNAEIGGATYCTFCGAENLIPKPGTPAVPYVPPQTPSFDSSANPGQSKAMLIFILTSVAISLFGTIAAIAVQRQTVPQINIQPMVAQAEAAAAEAAAIGDAQQRKYQAERAEEKRPRKPAEFASFRGNVGWTPLDPTGSVGTLEHFDAVANLPWVISLAKAWRPDAVLSYFMIDHVRRDGTADMVHDEKAQARYDFISPSAIAEWRAGKLQTDEVDAYFRVEMEEGKYQLISLASRPSSSEDEFRSVPTCTVPQLLSALEAAHKLGPGELWNVRYDEDTHHHSRWMIDPAFGDLNIPDVNAATCKVER